MNVYAWFGTKDPIALWVSLLVVILILINIFIYPLPGVFLISLSLFLLFRTIYLQFRPVEDEIELSVLRFSISAGFAIGTALTVGLILLMILVPTVSDYFLELMMNRNDRVITDPKAIFVRGALLGFSINILLISFSAMVIGAVKARWLQIQAVQEK